MCNFCQSAYRSSYVCMFFLSVCLCVCQSFQVCQFATFSLTPKINLCNPYPAKTLEQSLALTKHASDACGEVACIQIMHSEMERKYTLEWQHCNFLLKHESLYRGKRSNHSSPLPLSRGPGVLNFQLKTLGNPRPLCVFKTRSWGTTKWSTQPNHRNPTPSTHTYTHTHTPTLAPVSPLPRVAALKPICRSRRHQISNTAGTPRPEFVTICVVKKVKLVFLHQRSPSLHPAMDTLAYSQGPKTTSGFTGPERTAPPGPRLRGWWLSCSDSYML